MIILLSPAKTLQEDEWSLDNSGSSQADAFEPETFLILTKLGALTYDELQKVLGTSPDITRLAKSRIESWEAAKEKPCGFMYDGPAFKHLDATSLDASSLKSAQERLRIISGLYGLLRPLDLIKPYRLEMGAKLAVEGCKNLTQFWKPKLTDYLKQELGRQAAAERFVVNCASQEYSKAIDLRAVGSPVVEIKFPGPAIHAKAARGAMARYCITNKVKSVRELEGFRGTYNEWRYAPEESSDSKLVFNRISGAQTGKETASDAPKQEQKSLKQAPSQEPEAPSPTLKEKQVKKAAIQREKAKAAVGDNGSKKQTAKAASKASTERVKQAGKRKATADHTSSKVKARR